MIFGRLDETIPYREEIVARNPLSRTSHHNLGNAYYFAGLYSQAEAMFVRALDLRPNYLGGYFHLALVSLARGDLDKARTSLQREPDAGWRLQGKSLAAYASGDQATSDAALRNLQDAHSAEMAYQIAQTHAFRNEPDMAFDWLERAYAQHDSGLPELYVDPLLSNLHSDARWNVMLTQLGIIQ
jgi:serine/threonine-protein kinase